MDYQEFSKSVISQLCDTLGLDVDDFEVEGIAQSVADCMQTTARLRRCGPLSPAEVEPGMFVTVLKWNESIVTPSGMFGAVVQSDNSFVGHVLKVEAVSIPFVACVDIDRDRKVSLDMRRLTVGELSPEYVEAMKDKEEKE